MYLPVSENRRVRCVTIQDVNSNKLALPFLDNGPFSLTFQGVHQLQFVLNALQSLTLKTSRFRRVLAGLMSFSGCVDGHSGE